MLPWQDAIVKSWPGASARDTKRHRRCHITVPLPAALTVSPKQERVLKRKGCPLSEMEACENQARRPLPDPQFPSRSRPALRAQEEVQALWLMYVGATLWRARRSPFTSDSDLRSRFICPFMSVCALRGTPGEEFQRCPAPFSRHGYTCSRDIPRAPLRNHTRAVALLNLMKRQLKLSVHGPICCPMCF